MYYYVSIPTRRIVKRFPTPHLKDFSQLQNNSSSTVKPVITGHPKRRPNIEFQDQLSLNAGQKYCRILQYFHSSLIYNLSLRH